MSFLDNLESNLKALESREERDPKALAREAAVREAARSAALPIAPHADVLRNGPFLNGLLTACRDIGHPRRILVRAVWVDSMFRLETGAKRLELRLTPSPSLNFKCSVYSGLSTRLSVGDIERYALDFDVLESA